MRRPRGEQTHTLLHQGAHSKPEAVEQCEVILYHLGAGVAGVGIIPLVRAEPAGQREAVRPSSVQETASNKYQHEVPTTPEPLSLLSGWSDRQGPGGTGFLPVLYLAAGALFWLSSNSDSPLQIKSVYALLPWSQTPTPAGIAC